MNIPPDKNTRAEAMWRIISQEVDFRGKRVVDLGCGTGDFLWRPYVAGAEFVYGIDIDRDKIRRLGYLYNDISSRSFIDFSCESIPNDKSVNIKASYDIAMCFSVLPYLDDIRATLRWMSDSFELCIIEAQYDPEPYNVGVVSNRGMAQLLVNNGFNDVKPIGKTRVEMRNVDRTIWLCSKQELT